MVDPGLPRGEDVIYFCLIVVRLATGPKRSVGRSLGGEKNYFLIRGAEVVSGTSEMRSNPGPEVCLGSVRVGIRRVQSATPHTLALGSYLPILLAVQITSA